MNLCFRNQRLLIVIAFAALTQLGAPGQLLAGKGSKTKVIKGSVFGGMDTAADLAIDSSENVYVTGTSQGFTGGIDFATIKYDSSGTQQWKARFTSLLNRTNHAYAMVVDCAGNVYVTGSSQGIDMGLDYATVKYDSTGVQQWVARYNGTGNGEDIPYAIAVDGAGNVYVTGSSLGNFGGLDYVTIKYDSSGAQQWTYRWRGYGIGNNIPTAIAVDSNGNVFVTGSSLALNAGLNYMTIKLNCNGALVWWAAYNGIGNWDDTANALAIDNCGNVYVTGSSYGTLGGMDYVTIKYDTNGVQQWTHRWAGYFLGNNIARAIAVDCVGNVYVTGSSLALNAGLNYMTLKLNSSGGLVWWAAYNGLANGNDTAYALAVDTACNVYVTGSSLGFGSGLDYATVKYNSNGNQQWVARYNGPGNSDDTAIGVNVNSTSGNVYVTGTSLGLQTGFDYATVKYNSNGIPQWINRFNGP